VLHRPIESAGILSTFIVYQPVTRESTAKETTPANDTVNNSQFESSIEKDVQSCNNYVMRSTRNVVKQEEPELSHYSDPPLLVLVSLVNGPKHGHAMIHDILQLCGTRLGPGTLYGAIARLENQGWIEPLPPEERRRPYRITPQGLRVLKAKLSTLQQFTKVGLRRLEAL
jgi:DNA-binding PadR family transcriptional regulator